MTNGNGELPAGWRWVKLSEVCTFKHGGTPSKLEKAYWLGDIPWVSPKDMHRPTIASTEDTISEIALREKGLTLASTNSILVVVRSGILARTIPMAIPERPVSYNQDIKAITPKDTHLDVRYLYWVLKGSESNILQTGIKKGATVHSVISGFLEEFRIPLPPIIEQKRIAAVLGEQVNTVGQARVAARAQLEAAKALLAAHLREVFESGEARKWKTVRLGELLTLRKEIIHPKSKPVGPAVFVGLENIKSGTGLRFGGVNLEMSELTGRKPKFYAGDIVYGYLRPYLNKVWVAEFDGLCSVDQYVYSITTKEAETDFVAWFMRSDTYLSRAPISTTPGQLPRIRTEEVASVVINLPPLETQRRILNDLSGKLDETRRILSGAESQLAAIEQLPGALLQKAFNGQL